MASKKLEGTYADITGYSLSNVSLLKMFPIMEDDDGYKFMNIFRSYTMYDSTIQDVLYFDTYEAENDDWWDLIAYKLYQNVGLWWVLCMSNNIVNPFEELEAGKNLKMLYQNFVPQLIKEIDSLSDM